MKITRNRYQQGSIRKVPRAKGFAWEYRYYVTSDGKRKLTMQTFNGKLYATEADVRRAVGARVPDLNDGTVYSPSVAVTFGALLDRYIAEEIPARKSTRDSYTSIIKNHLRPRWENMVLSDIKPALIPCVVPIDQTSADFQGACPFADAPAIRACDPMGISPHRAEKSCRAGEDQRRYQENEGAGRHHV